MRPPLHPSHQLTPHCTVANFAHFKTLHIWKVPLGILHISKAQYGLCILCTHNVHYVSSTNCTIWQCSTEATGAKYVSLHEIILPLKLTMQHALCSTSFALLKLLCLCVLVVWTHTLNQCNRLLGRGKLLDILIYCTVQRLHSSETVAKFTQWNIV